MNQKCKVIAIANQKGGVGKTVTSACLGASLALNNKQVLLVDFDPQGNLTEGLGYSDSKSYKLSIKEAILNEINEADIHIDDYIIHTLENFDLFPANIMLSGMDLQMASVMSRETVFKRILEPFKERYDYILIDCNPALNLFTINALTAADSVIIPVQAEPFATNGLGELMKTIARTKKQLNPNLRIEGILITMTDSRTNLSKHISNEVRQNYGSNIKVFETEIPRGVKTAEASLFGMSPIKYAPKAESSLAYLNLAKEVEHSNEKRITKNTKQFVR